MKICDEHYIEVEHRTIKDLGIRVSCIIETVKTENLLYSNRDRIERLIALAIRTLLRWDNYKPYLTDIIRSEIRCMTSDYIKGSVDALDVESFIWDEFEEIKERQDDDRHEQKQTAKLKKQIAK